MNNKLLILILVFCLNMGISQSPNVHFPPYQDLGLYNLKTVNYESTTIEEPTFLKKTVYTSIGAFAGSWLLYLGGYYTALYFYDYEAPIPHLFIAAGTGLVGLVGGGFLGYKLAYKF